MTVHLSDVILTIDESFNVIKDVNQILAHTAENL